MTLSDGSLILKCERRVTVQISTDGGTEMLLNRKSTATKRSVKIGKVMGALVAGCAASSLALAAQASSGEIASAAPSTMVLHYFQLQTSLNFYNASDVLVHGYPPLGGHVREDDIDY